MAACMYGLMHGDIWMNVWVDKYDWIDGCMDGWMDRSIWMDGW